MNKDDYTPPQYVAALLCSAVEPRQFDPQANCPIVDAERGAVARLVRPFGERAALLVAHRHAASEVIAEHFDRPLAAKFMVVMGPTVSGGSVMNSAYLGWAMRVSDTVTH